MRRKRPTTLLSLFVLFAMFFVPFAGDARAEGRASGGEGATFSDKDLERYKMPSDGKAIEPVQRGREERRAELKRAEEERDREYWCKKGTQYGDRVETAREDVEEAEKRLSEAKEKHFRANKKKAEEAEIARAEEKLEKMRKVLRKAERDLSGLEDEAHRKGVSPGWLRCQFE